MSWAKDDKLVLEANPDYWGGRIDVDRVVFRPVPETAPRVAGLLKGEIDLITQLTPDHWDRINQNPTTKGASALYAGLYVLGTNSKVPPLNNWTLKKAMQLGVDREAIVKDLWRGRGIIPTGPIAKGDTHFDTSLPPLPYDPSKAKELVKQSGYKGEPIYLETTVGLIANDKADVRGHRGHVEGRRHQRRRRGGRVLGARPEEPRADVQGALVVGSRPRPCATPTG